MPVAIPNFRFRYLRKGKPVFVPSTIGRRIGKEIKGEVERAYDFDPMYSHLNAGGHVGALHEHRENTLFARIDLSRFFYSISRRRIKSALDRVGVGKADFYSKWSTVRNPYEDPRYALPYGFVQSPILASLVLATSALGKHLSSLPSEVHPTVYVDDITLSSQDSQALTEAFDATLAVIQADGFTVSDSKVRPPSSEIDIFNCDLSQGKTVVRDERVAEFLAKAPEPASEEAFFAYCASVEAGNSDQQ